MPQNIMCVLHATIWPDHFKFASYRPALYINMSFSTEANGERLDGNRVDSFTVVIVIRWEGIVGHILKI